MRKSFYSLLAGIIMLIAYSCSDNNIGQSITDTVVQVVTDSSFTVTGSTVENKELPARTITQLLGVIDAKGYGLLETDVVTQFMPASLIDTVGVAATDIDSCKFIFDIPIGGYTGDSIAPMRTTIYRLNKALPSKLTSTFDPSEYYSTSDVLGSTTYTASAIMAADTLLEDLDDYGIREFTVDAPVSLAQEIYNKFFENQSIFLDPVQFATFFPGVYIKNTFGSGRVMNIYNTEFRVFYHRHITKDDGTDSIDNDEMSYMGATAEVLSNNNIKLTVADEVKAMVAAGDEIIMSPAGYEVQIKFPIQEIIDKFRSGGSSELAVINDLSFEIPASAIENDYGIDPPDYLLMVKTSEKDEFFATNHNADSESSFYAAYSSTTDSYTFSDMRDFVLDIIENKNGVAEETDMNFTLTPVDLIAEETTSSSSSYYYYYYYSSSSASTTVVGVRPALNKPAFAKLDLSKAKIKLTYSTQSMRIN